MIQIRSFAYSRCLLGLDDILFSYATGLFGLNSSKFSKAYLRSKNANNYAARSACYLSFSKGNRILMSLLRQKIWNSLG